MPMYMGVRDFMPTYDLDLQAIFVGFIIELGSRHGVHFDVLLMHESPSSAANPLTSVRNYECLIQYNDKKFGYRLAHGTTGINFL